MIKFTSGLNTAKNTDYVETKLYRIKFPTKNSVDTYLYLPMEWS